MKRAMLSLLAVVFVAGLVGCVNQHGRRPWACMGGSCAQAPENCQSCDESSSEGYFNPGSGRCCRECGGRGCHLCRRACEGQTAGPSSATVAYPYYTTRGPRDFLANNPPSIGP